MSNATSSWVGQESLLQCTVAASALITYDVLFTMPLEVALVWQGNWGVPAILYMLNRYGVLVHSYVVVALMPILLASQDSQDPGMSTYCQYWGYIGSWSVPIITLLSEALLALRVIAFYGEAFRPAFWIGVAWFLCVCAGFEMLIHGWSSTNILRQNSPAGPVFDYSVTGVSCNGSVYHYLMLALSRTKLL